MKKLCYLLKSLLFLGMLSFFADALLAKNGEGVLNWEEKELGEMREYFKFSPLPITDYLTDGNWQRIRSWLPSQEPQILKEILQPKHQKFLRQMVPYEIYDSAMRQEKHGLVRFMDERKKWVDTNLGKGAYDFLTSSKKGSKVFYENPQEPKKSVLSKLLEHEKRKFLNFFVSSAVDEPQLSSAIEEGRIGLALCIRALHRNRRENFSYDQKVLSALNRYGATQGWDGFLHDVIERNIFELSKASLGFACSWSLLGCLRNSDIEALSVFFSLENFKPLKPFRFDDSLRDLLYLEATRLGHKELTDFILTLPDLSKPSQKIEDYVLHASVRKYQTNPSFIIWLLTQKPGLKGNLDILDHSLLEKAESWLRQPSLGDWNFIYELKPVLMGRQGFLDDLYSMASAYGEAAVMDTSALSLGKPSLDGEDRAFLEAAANGHILLLEKLARNNPSQDVLDKALELTVTYSQDGAFDFLLDGIYLYLPVFPFIEESTRLFSQENLEKCFHIKPQSRNFSDNLSNLIGIENRFQKRLCEKFNLSPLGRFSDFFKIPVSLPSLTVPEFSRGPIDEASLAQISWDSDRFFRKDDAQQGAEALK